MSTYAEGRKEHVIRSVAEVVALVQDTGIMDVTEVAEKLNIATATARRKLDGAVYRGDLVRDEYDEMGRRLQFEHWRYGDAR